MQGFFSKLREGLSRFMNGRYGCDHLGMAIASLAIVCSIIASIGGWPWLSIAATVLIVVSMVRVLSRDIASRRRENDSFLALVAKLRSFFHRQKSKWENRSTKAYVRCPRARESCGRPAPSAARNRSIRSRRSLTDNRHVASKAKRPEALGL